MLRSIYEIVKELKPEKNIPTVMVWVHNTERLMNGARDQYIMNQNVFTLIKVFKNEVHLVVSAG